MADSLRSELEALVEQWRGVVSPQQAGFRWCAEMLSALLAKYPPTPVLSELDLRIQLADANHELRRRDMLLARARVSFERIATGDCWNSRELAKFAAQDLGGEYLAGKCVRKGSELK